MGMARLQRPPTLKEIVMRSLLQWREPADTLVDDEIDARTTEVPTPPPWDMPASRDTLPSVVFDLFAPPRAEAKSSP
jgi:hypothetical protein